MLSLPDRSLAPRVPITVRGVSPHLLTGCNGLAIALMLPCFPWLMGKQATTARPFSSPLLSLHVP